MTLFLRESDEFGPVRSGFLDAMDSEYATHLLLGGVLVVNNSDLTGNLIDHQYLYFDKIC
jgi:hypothetical protein